MQSEYPEPQVYEQVDPLQLADEAWMRLHLSPHALQLLVVLRPVQVPLHSVSRQVHAPFEQSGVGCAQVAWFCHVPVLLHVRGVLPLQLVWPGAQTPVHAPATHVWFVHDTGPPHVPLAVHVSTPLPEHCV